ncbi:MAG: hypothetical protein ABWY45_10995, partial [Mycobacterium sp.]
VVETDVDGQLVAHVAFDPDDVDAASAELDARYLATEAAPHSRTWSLIVSAATAVNRHETPYPAADYVVIDHRVQHTTIAASTATDRRQPSLDLTPTPYLHIEAVHRLSDYGAVITKSSYGTTQESVAAEWRMIQVLTVDGDQIDRVEVFDEADIEAALARFGELARSAQRMENVASEVYERYWTCFEAADWLGLARQLADDVLIDDRRSVVGAGRRYGRDAAIADSRAVVTVGVRSVTATVMAIRGERHALHRVLWSGREPEAFHTETLCVVETDGDDRIAAHIMFGSDDVDAAFVELDARYLGGGVAARKRP